MFSKDFICAAAMFTLTCVTLFFNLAFAQPDLVADRIYLRTAPR